MASGSALTAALRRVIIDGGADRPYVTQRQRRGRRRRPKSDYHLAPGDPNKSSAACSMAFKTGSIVRPRAVNRYSTCGGVVGKTVRFTMFSRSSARSLLARTFAEMPFRSRCSSVKRRGPSRRNQRIRGTHGPERIARYFSSGHGLGGGGCGGWATERAIAMSKQVTARYLLPKRKRGA